MPYINIPGIRAAFNDGEFAALRTTGQDNILIVGPATSGLTDTRFNVASVSAAVVEFGAASPIMRQVQEALAQGGNNVSVLRSGGREGSYVFTDSAGATLTIRPSSRDNEILERYALFVENDGLDNRYLIYDITKQNWVYDSDEVLVLNSDVIEVTDTGIGLFTLFVRSTPHLASSLATLVKQDYTVTGAITATSSVSTAGTDGTSVSLAERYAALNTSYFNLDFKDADYLLPTDVYFDDATVVDFKAVNKSYDPVDADTDLGRYGNYFKGIPVKGDSTDMLGWVWEYVYRGKKYTYMADVEDYATGVAATPVAATLVAQGDLVLTAQKAGKGGNGIRLTINASTDAGPNVTFTETAIGFDILVSDDGTASIGDTVIAINLALGTFVLANGVLASTLVQAAGVGAGTLVDAAVDPLTSGTGGAVLTHTQLTGDTVPTVVATRFAAAVDAEFRECNFGHQLASHCHVASTNWSTTVGMISFKPPTGWSRAVVADWVGELPAYIDQGTYKYIDLESANGAGILGHKLLAGAVIESNGYRSHLVTDGDGTDGIQGGGLILTVGASLPNGVKHPYGIKDADEAVGGSGKPIDIGKYLFITYDWPILSNGYDGGSTYRGDFTATFAGKIATLPVNEEPIGLNGFVRSVQRPPRIHSAQLSELAGLRTIGLRQEDGAGLVITSAKTAAHPDSDYTRLSTIRSVNAILTRVRRIAKPFIGRAYTSQNIISLQTALDGYFQASYGGLHTGAKAVIQYTRADKIAGRLTIKLRIVPPFSIDAIFVEISLAADESEL